MYNGLFHPSVSFASSVTMRHLGLSDRDNLRLRFNLAQVTIKKKCMEPNKIIIFQILLVFK